MNFFERQEIARRQSRRLIVLFTLAVVAIVIAVNAAVLIGLGLASPSMLADAGGLLALVRHKPGMMASVSLIVVAVIALASLARMAALRGGGGAVARQLDGTPLPDQGGDFHQRRLRNVVEEIAIASGVPVPEIYVLEHEPGINAFAAGWSPADAAVAVTRGALERLNRDELQGVIAHEFSHILNGDMRLNIRLMGVLFGILMLTMIGRRVLIHTPRGRNSKGAGPVLVIALLLIVIGYVGVLFGRLIKAGVSRQREYLADASAVQFTRQTAGIAGALKKIGGLTEGSRLAAAETEEVSHMLFGDGLGFSGLLATHPPLLARIQALEPQFKPEQMRALRQRWAAQPPSGQDEDLALGLTGAGDGLPEAERTLNPAPTAAVAQVGHPRDDDFQRAGSLLRAIPESLHGAAHDHDAAPALLLALLLSGDDEVLERQLALLSARQPRDVAERARQLSRQCRALHPLLRLPLAELAFPRLRRRPRPALTALAETCSALTHADRRVSVFEYALATLFDRHVLEALDPADSGRVGRAKLSAAREPALTLLAVLAAHGHRDQDAARRAYLAGLARMFPGQHVDYLPPDDWTTALDRAWPPLDALQPEAKIMLIEALVVCIGHDGRMSLSESELLRTICGVLHCPLPPVLEQGLG